MKYVLVIMVLLMGQHKTAIFTQGIPIMSPCPKMFQYRFNGSDWFGLLSVRNPDGQQLNLRITLSLRGKPMTNYLGEIELLTRGQQKKDAPILYKVKFPKTHLSPPKVQQIAINGHIVCLGVADQGMFVTQIQLEHIRKFSFVPDAKMQMPLNAGLLSAPPSSLQGEGNENELQVQDFDDFPQTHLDGLGTKHLPLQSHGTPVRTSKDVCGTIDNRIRYQVLHASEKQSRSIKSTRKEDEPVSRTDIFFGKLLKESTKINDAASHNKDNVAKDVDVDDDEDDGDVNSDGASLPLVTGDDSDYDDTSSDSSDPTATQAKQIEELPAITRGAWPWLAAIYVNNLTSLAYQCGGTLVSARIVVSSAHCFKMFQKAYAANEVLVFLGRHNLKNWNEEGSIAAPVDDIFIHPDYDSHLNSYDADIAVLVLKHEVRFSTFIRPACLWSGSTDVRYIEGEQGVVVGWSRGTTDKKYTAGVAPAAASASLINTVPRVISAPIVPKEVCFESNAKFRSLSSNRTFCAGQNGATTAQLSNDKVSKATNKLAKRNFPRGPCTGDSGAGLMIYKNNRWFLRGLVSASLPSEGSAPSSSWQTLSTERRESGCKDNQYVIYSDAAKFSDWIFAFII